MDSHQGDQHAASKPPLLAPRKRSFDEYSSDNSNESRPSRPRPPTTTLTPTRIVQFVKRFLVQTPSLASLSLFHSSNSPSGGPDNNPIASPLLAAINQHEQSERHENGTLYTPTRSNKRLRHSITEKVQSVFLNIDRQSSKAIGSIKAFDKSLRNLWNPSPVPQPSNNNWEQSHEHLPTVAEPKPVKRESIRARRARYLQKPYNDPDSPVSAYSKNNRNRVHKANICKAGRKKLSADHLDLLLRRSNQTAPKSQQDPNYEPVQLWIARRRRDEPRASDFLGTMEPPSTSQTTLVGGFNDEESPPSSPDPLSSSLFDTPQQLFRKELPTGPSATDQLSQIPASSFDILGENQPEGVIRSIELNDDGLHSEYNIQDAQQKASEQIGNGKYGKLAFLHDKHHYGLTALQESIRSERNTSEEPQDTNNPKTGPQPWRLRGGPSLLASSLRKLEISSKVSKRREEERIELELARMKREEDKRLQEALEHALAETTDKGEKLREALAEGVITKEKLRKAEADGLLEKSKRIEAEALIEQLRRENEELIRHGQHIESHVQQQPSPAAEPIAFNDEDIDEEKPRMTVSPISFIPELPNDISRLVDEAYGRPGQSTVSESRAVTYKDLQTTRPGTWLNDEVINVFLEIAAAQKNAASGYVKKRSGNNKVQPPPFHAFGSHMMTKYKQAGWAGVQRWWKRAGLEGADMLKAKTILIPVNDGSHWTLWLINVEAQKIVYYDSLSSDKNIRHEDCIRDMLRSNLGAKYVEETWKASNGRSTQQSNGNDCGVFTCVNGLALLAGRSPPDVIREDGIKNARRWLCAVVLNNKFGGGFDPLQN